MSHTGVPAAELEQHHRFHHPIPPAVAEHLAEQSAARESSPMRRHLAVADRLVAEAEAAGIAVEYADVGNAYTGVRLMAADPALAPALAVELGLSRRDVFTHTATHSIEVFEGTRDGLRVTTQHTLPTSVLAGEVAR